jgi:hypothetical protein
MCEQFCNVCCASISAACSQSSTVWYKCTISPGSQFWQDMTSHVASRRRNISASPPDILFNGSWWFFKYVVWSDSSLHLIYFSIIPVNILISDATVQKCAVWNPTGVFWSFAWT